MNPMIGLWLFLCPIGLLGGLMALWAEAMNPHRRKPIADAEGARIVILGGLVLWHVLFLLALLLVYLLR